LIHQEYFFLIEPDTSGHNNFNNSKVIVHIKQPLKHIESMIDKTEPRNLIFGMPVFIEG
jgi:hypothetical protein